jgi:hypothetical protein
MSREKLEVSHDHLTPNFYLSPFMINFPYSSTLYNLNRWIGVVKFPKIINWMNFTVEIIAFSGIAPCSLAEVDRRFGYTYCIHYHPDDKISTHLWNVGPLKQNYTSLCTRRLSTFTLVAVRTWSLITLPFWKWPTTLSVNTVVNIVEQGYKLQEIIKYYFKIY